MSDAIDTTPLETITVAFLNTLKTSGIPNYNIKLKIGTPIMFLKNRDQSEGLRNRTRLIVTRLANHVTNDVIRSYAQAMPFLDPRIESLLVQARFSDVAKLGQIKIDDALVTALVEK
ncbi:hypothetical protein JHK87_055549 [Glycine soja]|nr:hypothetical protein JHK87_055549 [Glycine soja]